MEEKKKKKMLCVYLEPEVRDMLDEMHIFSIKIRNKKSNSFIVSEGIKIMHDVMKEKGVMDGWD